MRVLCQRVTGANVTVDSKIVGNIAYGLVLFVGFTQGDSMETLEKMALKVLNLRIFDDDCGVMNKSILDVSGELLVVSQFTLYANTKKGNRPSYGEALNQEDAKILYDNFCSLLKTHGLKVETGIFRADMKVSLTNDGPITIMLEK